MSNQGALMFSFNYPATFTKTGDARVLVRFPDLKGCLTDGKDSDEAFREAVDCLDSYLCIAMQRKEPIPPPSRPRRGARLIPVPLYLAPKVALYMAMKEERITNAQLARRLRVRETIVRRLLDPSHESRAESLQTAISALGRSMVVSIASAA